MHIPKNQVHIASKVVAAKWLIITGKAIPAEVVPRRPGDPPRLIACSDLAKKELGWKPQFENAQAIIESVWRWMEKHPNGYQDR